MTESYPVKDLQGQDADTFKPMLFGGLLGFVIGVIPLLNISSCFCIPQILSAVVAVHLFTKNNQLTVSMGKGIMIGIGASLIGCVLAFLVGTILTMAGINPMEDMFKEFGLKMAEMSGDPNVVEQAKENMNREPTSVELMTQTAIGLAFTLFFGLIGGVIGGAIGAAAFKRAPQEEGVV